MGSEITTIETDYVVAGGGSAGCVVASRLSESGRNGVTLIEAGRRDSHFLIHWPAGFAHLQNARFRWEWLTTPQALADRRTVPTPQGKVLGGGSSVNGMVYIRGNRRDYDQWAAMGNTEWSYEKVLPFFRRAEQNERYTTPFHGTDGPLHVSEQRTPSPLSQRFVRAAQEVGLEHNADFNGSSQSGAGLYQVTQYRGRRWSAARAYLGKASGRKNLSILTRHNVTRVLMQDGRAIGLEYKPAGSDELRRIVARKEVILSAGAVGSPKLMMLSGIGPGAELQRLGIPVRHDLPGVGENLHDHVDAYCCIGLNRPISYTGHERGPRALLHALEYLAFRRGAVSSNVCEGGVFASSGRDDPAWPDIQLHFMPAALQTHQALAGHGATILSTALRPKSRGKVKLSSPDPFAHPAIDPNFFSHPDDLPASVAALKLARDIAAAPSLAALSAGERYPGPDCATDADLADYIRASCKTDFHPVGTCRMGSDPMAVVDQSLRVRGIAGLRVIDASIMPTIVSGNTNAPAIMIGEKGADYILSEAPRG